MGVPGRLCWNAATNDGAASTPKTCSPSSTSTTVMGTPGPQPRSITLLRCGSVFAHLRTAFTPIAFERVRLLPRRARNSADTASYPLDRSVMDSRYQSFRCHYIHHGPSLYRHTTATRTTGTAHAHATRNTGILRCAQDDDVEWGGGAG
jgi:hypothetical protein